MAEKLNSADADQKEQGAKTIPAASSEPSAVIPEKAKRALTETRAAIKDIRAGMAKEFGTVTRDIAAALQKSAEGQPETASAVRIAQSMRRQGPVVGRDINGLVTTVTYVDGTSRKFAYDDTGKVHELTDKDGLVWRLQDGIWIQFAADGSITGQTWDGCISIDSAGVYCYRDVSDGSCVFERPDGSKLVEDQGGLKMEADQHGHVIFIQYPNGSSRKFQYAADGSLNKVIDPDETSWKTSDGLRWFQYGPDGIKRESTWFGKMSVDSTGSYRKEDAGTGQKIIEEPYGGTITETPDGTRLLQNPDGTVLVEKPDGARWYTTVDGTHISETPTGFLAIKPYGAAIEADEARRVTKITYPDKTVRTFKYNDSGLLAQIFDRDGTIWKGEPVNCWVQYRTDGKKTGQVRGGDISVDEQGNCIYRDCENRMAWIEQPDGLRATEAADGSRIETSADGLTAIYIAASTRQFAVSTEGFLKYETKEGDRLGEIALDAVCYRHFFETGYTPVEEEVAKEKKRLSRITSMDDVRELPVGKTITIKTKVETITSGVIREVKQITRSMRVAVAAAVEESASTQPVHVGKDIRPTIVEPRKPKDTAEMLLPWFSVELDLSEPTLPEPELPSQAAAEQIFPAITTDEFGRVTRVQYSEDSSKSFEYREDGQIIQLIQSNGRTTKRNPDSTWTSYTRQGRQMVTSPEALLTVDERGTINWEYQSDSSRFLERTDGSSVLLDGAGRLRTFTSAAHRAFTMNEDGDLQYDVEDEDTLADIAADALRAWYWQNLPGELPAHSLEEMLALIRSANGLRDASQIAEGDRLILPQPDSAALAGKQGALEAAPKATPLPSTQGPSEIPPQATSKRVAPWSARPTAAKPEPTSVPPLKETPKTLGPSSPTPAASKVEPKSEPSVPAKRVAPWSSAKQTLGKGETASPPPVIRATPWSTKSTATKVEPGAEPQAQETVKRVTPWSAKSESKTATGDSIAVSQAATNEEGADDQARVRIELDLRGRVLKVFYADKTWREFEYDRDGVLIEIRQQNGRITKRNPDASWTSYARDGRKMNASSRAKLTVDREGDIIWEFEDDGSISIQRVDGAAIFIDNHGQLRRFVSDSARAFEVNDAGAMTYEVQADETLEDIAADALKAWSWQVSFYQPSPDDLGEIVRLIVAANKLTSARQIAEGDTLAIPQPVDISVVQLNPLQRAIQNTLSLTLQDSAKIPAQTVPPSKNSERLAEYAVWRDAHGRITALTYPGGSVREFKYDSDGNLIELTQPDGRLCKRVDADQWSVFKADGSPTGLIDKVQHAIDSDGVFTSQAADGSRKFTHTPSGHRALESPDGWKVFRNPDNLVTRIVYADSKECTFEYGPQTQLLVYNDRNGQVWKASGATAWTRYGVDGKEIEKKSSLAILVNADGHIILQDLVKNCRTIDRPDGGKSIQYKDSSRLEFDPLGRPSRYRSPSRRMYSISKSGVLLHDVIAGELLAAIAVDALAFLHRDDATFKPSADEIDRVCESVLQANNLKEGVELQADTMLIIPVS